MAIIAGNFIALDDGTMLTPPPAVHPLPPPTPPPALTAPAPSPQPAPAPPPAVVTPPNPSPAPAPVVPDNGPQALAVPGVIVRTGTPSLGGETVIAPVPTVEAQAGGVTVVPPGSEVGGVPTPGNTGDDPAADIANANDPDLSDLPGWDLLDPFGVQEFSTDSMPLKGDAALTSIAQACSDYGIDPRACVANALHEGPGGGIGDSGDAYGPFQIHATDGRLPQFADKGKNNATVNAWAWSDNGIRYGVRAMATGKPSARGLIGHAAVYAIVYGFEKPADKHGAYVTRSAEYDKLVALGSGWASYASALLKGPIAGGATATPPSGSSPSAAPYTPAGVNTQWRALVTSLWTTIPTQHDKVRSLNKAMLGAIK